MIKLNANDYRVDGVVDWDTLLEDFEKLNIEHNFEEYMEYLEWLNK